MPRGGLLVAAALALAACAPQRPAETVWLMPEPPQEEPSASHAPPPEPPDARPLLPRGGPFAYAQAASDGLVGDPHGAARAPIGDLPETGFAIGARPFWRTDEARALGEARASGRGLVLDFTAEWCAPCRVIDREIFADEGVRARVEQHFVPLRVDVTEETMANRAQMERYGVVRLPAVLILDARGRELDRIERGLDSEAFLARLEQARSRR